MKIHYHPYFCFLDDISENITASTDINKVTCQQCIYYYFHPEARDLEIQFRYSKLKNSIDSQWN